MPHEAARTVARAALSVALFAAPLLSGCRPALSQILKDSGYCELRPPSTLVPPGTVVRMRSRDPLIVDIVCTARESLGDAVQPLSSPSADIAERLRQGRSFRIAAAEEPVLRTSASLGASLVESVDLSFLDVTVLSLSDATVLRAAENREEACRRAIESARAAGAELAMVREVVQATVEYTFQLRAEATLDAQTRLAAIRSLAPSLGADASTATERSVRGKALFWGAVEDRRLLSTTVTPAAPTERLVGPVPMTVAPAPNTP